MKNQIKNLLYSISHSSTPIRFTIAIISQYAIHFINTWPAYTSTIIRIFPNLMTCLLYFEKWLDPYFIANEPVYPTMMRILIEATMPLNIWTTMEKKYADLRGINIKYNLNWGLSHIAAQSVFENSENRLSSVSICCIMTLAPSSALESYNCTQNVYKSTLCEFSL